MEARLLASRGLRPCRKHADRPAVLLKTRRVCVALLLEARVLSRCYRSMDLDLPAEVDDEYWENEDPELAFRQPPDKPSKVSFFVSWIKLSQIIARALETFVSYDTLLRMLRLLIDVLISMRSAGIRARSVT